MSRLQVLLWERPPVVLSSAERSTVLTTTDCLQQFCVTNYECIYRDLDGEDRFTVVLLSEVVSHVGDDHLSLEMVLEPHQSRRLSLLNDSIHHADGQLAEGSIALCEVQAYAYGARHLLAPTIFSGWGRLAPRQRQRRAVVPAAGAVLRLFAPRGGGAHVLPGGLQSAGLGEWVCW
ncbi:MAG: hypothetical protein WBN80_11665 [Prochlorococcaceae cyanobacterium]